MKASEFVQRGWCKHTQALDKHGKMIDVSIDDKVNPDLDRVCLVGGLHAEFISEGTSLEEQALLMSRVFREVEARFGYHHIVEWNDAEKTTQQDVINFLKSIGH